MERDARNKIEGDLRSRVQALESVVGALEQDKSRMDKLATTLEGQIAELEVENKKLLGEIHRKDGVISAHSAGGGRSELATMREKEMGLELEMAKRSIVQLMERSIKW